MKRKGKTFIISGPSGVGKSTVLRSLLEGRDDLYFSVSATTRVPRPGEVDGVHYHFIDVSRFRELIGQDEFLEYAEYVGNFYNSLETHYDLLPLRIQKMMPYMMTDNWLLSYASIEGISRVLDGMNRRTKNRSGMNEAVHELELFYNEFETEFSTFFDKLVTFSKQKLEALNNKNL